ncbi:ketopantoate reductase family protein [Streptomyces brasiliensis]|uniref:2-dehydropantoate 2-reductase n=1 Tax=Streptomyces brasiliensis TaxID=1954 RepID=A0A917KYZ6_9ACTN|nr:2-dehydropantoate 2-reductase [Streptomyces brasiliensis]GGJ34474.1 2-dehydropantoate 2-reductase [Streptomyces brasiliensis]
MRIAVVGAGGVGGYFGARLAAGGHEVTFVARGAHLRAVREHGLLVRSPLGDLRVPAASVVPAIAELPPVDVVIVAVKLWDTEDVAAQLRDVVGAGTRVVSLQNGVRKDDVLRRHLPAEAVWGGVCYISAVIEEPGVVVHRGELQKLVFGPYGEDSHLTAEFLDACRSCGIEADLSPDIERVVWEKFVFLVGLSATTSAVRQPIGVIRADSRSRELLHDVMAEALEVGRAAGVKLDPGFADERLAFCDTVPAGMSSSMHHDLTQGNRPELPWLSGSVVDLGRELGIPTPRNRTIADILAPYELGRPEAGS